MRNNAHDRRSKKLLEVPFPNRGDVTGAMQRACYDENGKTVASGLIHLRGSAHFTPADVTSSSQVLRLVFAGGIWVEVKLKPNGCEYEIVGSGTPFGDEQRPPKKHRKSVDLPERISQHTELFATREFGGMTVLAVMISPRSTT